MALNCGYLPSDATLGKIAVCYTLMYHISTTRQTGEEQRKEGE
jgi:hypothetical protein